MHVVIANDYAHVRGGTDEVAISSACALTDAGEKVTFFCGVGPVDPRLEARPQIKLACLGQQDILNDPNRLRGVTRGMWNPAASAHLRMLLAECVPADTVLHVHGWTKALTASVFHVARQMGFSSLATLHDYFVTCPNGAFYEYPARAVCLRRPLGPSCLSCQCDRRSYAHKLWRVARQSVQKISGLPRHLRHAVAVSDLSRAFVQRHLPSTTKLHLVYNPIALEKTPPVEAANNQHITYVGRLAYEKGPQLLAQAVAELGVPVRFVGDGDMREEILRLNPRAEITGWVSPAEALGWLAQARAVVLPSLWMETFGLTVPQALGRGVPVIVSDRCGAKEFVRDGVSGFVIPAGDLLALREKIGAFADPSVVSAFGVAAYARYWENPPDLARHGDDLRRLYSAILPGALVAAGAA